MIARIALIIFILIIVGSAGAGIFYWRQISVPAGDTTDTVPFVVKTGEGAAVIGQRLEAQGLIRGSYWFEVYVYFDGSETDFLSGAYEIPKNYNIREVVAALTSERGAQERIITILEGWEIDDMAAYLEEQEIVSADAFREAAGTTDSRELIPGITYSFLADKPADQGLEGYLFPDTYRIAYDAAPADVIKRMLDNFGTKFDAELRQAAAAQGLTLHEAVTLASIIEEEVRTDTDRALVSGIFHNRLEAGMALQADSTVNYVTGKDTPAASADDIEVDNPYNTYKYKGLPPGPISSPSLSALEAAVNPAETDYWYFLNAPDGTTVFSKTFEEHVANKRKYL